MNVKGGLLGKEEAVSGRKAKEEDDGLALAVGQAISIFYLCYCSSLEQCNCFYSLSLPRTKTSTMKQPEDSKNTNHII
jgi:hypothetical protein